MVGMFLAALDQTVVSTAIRTIADDLQGYDLQAWATTAFLITSTIATPLYGKLSDIYGRAAVLPVRDRDLRRRLGAVRHGRLDVRAGRLPGGPGHRRRRPDVAGAGDHRRHRAAAGARAVPGLLHGRLRHLERARPGHRRLLRRPGPHPGHRRLALDLLHQRAAGRARLRRRLAGAAPAAQRRDAPHRLARRAGADHLPGAAARRRRAGPHLGLELRPGAALLRHRRRRLRAFMPGRAGLPGRRPAAAAAVPQPHLHGERRRQRSSWAPACSAGSCCCPSTCRSCTAPAPPWPACR